MANVDLFEAFVRVVELGGLSRAATSYGISPAAMTKKINSLEETLGLRLLERTTRRVALTENGEAIFQQCLKIIQDLKDTAAIVEQLKGEPSGALRILASLDVGEQYILPYLAEFMLTHKKIQLNLDLADRLPDFSNGSFDLIIGFGIESPNNWRQIGLFTTQYITCASPFYLQTYGTPQSLEELIHHRLIAQKTQNRGQYFVFNKPLNMMLRPTIQFNSSHTLCIAAINGIGIAQLPEFLITQNLQSGTLVEILKKERESPTEYYYYIKEQAPSGVRLFLDFMQTAFTKKNN